MITTTTDTVAVWSHNGIPTRLVWNGMCRRVSNIPTELWNTIGHPMLTHPPKTVIGWRFQPPPTTWRVFDMRPRSGAKWELLRI